MVFVGLISTALISFTFSRKFPDMDYTTTTGKKIDLAYFAARNTLVVHYHLGCPGAMYAARDLQKMSDSLPDNVQILTILENTPAQLEEFNSTEQNTFSELRNYFKLEPLSGDIVTECPPGSEKTSVVNGNVTIGRSCNRLSKKLHLKYSPSFLIVNRAGKITKRINGYRTSKNFLWELIQKTRE